MARAYASTILDAPVETAWSVLRDFDGLPSWHPAIARSEIEDGLDADVVGCVRAFELRDGTRVRERLLSLCDRTHSLSYDFQTPAFPVTDYLARIRLMPVTATGQTFAEWEATFEEAPEDAGKHAPIISQGVFQAGWDALKAALPGRSCIEGIKPWGGFPPNKVWCSAVIEAPAEAVWGVIRDFAGMGGWHDAIREMQMLGGARSDKVSATRAFRFGEGALKETLLHLDDRERSFSYFIAESGIPWLNYVSGPRLWEVTDGNRTFGAWTGDWVADPRDDVTLIPFATEEVYLKAFRTVGERLAAR